VEIIKPLYKRNGFQTFGMRVLGYTLKPFFGCRCKVPDSIQQLKEPVVFVCNHYELFGPASIALSLPMSYRVWVNSIVVNATDSIDKMIIGFQHTFPFLSEKGARRVLGFVAPAVERVIRRFQPIAVYHDNLAKQMHAIEDSVQAMTQGENIVLFPETALPKYSKGWVTDFFRSFALIGEYYRRKTGGNALFCPVYVDKKHRSLRFGQPVRYGTGKASEECGKLVDSLHGQLLSMAEDVLGPAPSVERGAL